MTRMKYVPATMLAAAALCLLSSCGESDAERKARAEQFTTSTKPAPNPEHEELSDLVRTEIRPEATAPFGAPKFEPFSEYKGEDMRQVTGVSGRSLLLCFTAPWCPHSNKMRTQLKKVAKAEKGALQVVVVNADEYPAVAEEFRITKVPTTILYTEGVKLSTFEGSYAAADLRNMIRRVLSPSDDSSQ